MNKFIVEAEEVEETKKQSDELKGKWEWILCASILN